MGLSTRSEIIRALDALADPKAGLTLSEVRTHCESCEGDEQIVGNTLALLVKEGILMRDGFRAGRNVFRYADPTQKPASDKPLRPAQRRAGGRPPNGKSSLEGRIIEALQQKSPMSASQLAACTSAGVSSVYATLSVMRKKGAAVPVQGRRGIWQLPAPRANKLLMKTETTFGTDTPESAALVRLVKGPSAAAPVNGAHVVGPVEEGIPLPSCRFGPAQGECTARLRELAVGDSFYTTVPHATFAKSAKRVGIKITRRKEAQGFRVWRVE